MSSTFLLAWQQLSYQRMKLAVASAGVVVAVMLMLVQLGIREGAMDNSVAIARRVNADLVVVSPRTLSIFQSAQFPRRLLFRLGGHSQVDDVQEMYMSQGRWRNMWTYTEHPISIFGVDPRSPLMDFPGLSDRADELLMLDRAAFDGRSRDTYGPVTSAFKQTGVVETEVNLRKIKVVQTVDVGVSITTDGNLFVSQTNFLRLFPQRNPGAIDLGLIRVKPGADLESVASDLRPLLGTEAKIMTREQLIASEIAFVRKSAPIDFIFGMGAAVGFFIGFVVVYQILYTEVTNHLPQFATMKAMGFTDKTLLLMVYYQGMVLSVLGYIPGFVLALWLYRVATKAIQMQFSMTWERAVMVFSLTVVMCLMSATIALQKIRRVDPADVF